MSADYETLIQWQLRITLGKPKPNDLTNQESKEYDRLADSIDFAASKGYVVSFPSGPGSESPERGETSLEATTKSNSPHSRRALGRSRRKRSPPARRWRGC